MSRLLLGLVFLSSTATLACQESSVSVFGTNTPIIEGEPAPGLNGVVLVTGPALSLCTGTLISERVVLTAKHCVQAPSALETQPAAELQVGIGASLYADDGPTWYTVESVHAVPGSYSVEDASTLVGTDIALLVLTKPASAEPFRVHLSSPEDLVGERARAVGFGLTDEGESGTRYQVEAMVTSVTKSVLVVDGAVCQGDSGGPLLDDKGAVVGVVSLGQGPGCPDGPSYFERVDTHRALLLGTVARAGGCLLEGTERCDGFDNDCDGEIDLGCAELGEACRADRECQEEQRCDESVCIDRTSDIGRACKAHQDCYDGMFCAEPGTQSFCTQACEVSEECGASFVCADVVNGKACLPVDEGRADDAGVQTDAGDAPNRSSSPDEGCAVFFPGAERAPMRGALWGALVLAWWLRRRRAR